MLLTRDVNVAKAGLRALQGETPLIYGADAKNWEAFADLAKESKASLGIIAGSLSETAELTEKIKAKGVEDLVIDPGGQRPGCRSGNWDDHSATGDQEELPRPRFSCDCLPWRCK